VEAAGIALESREAQVPFLSCLYGNSGCFWLETGWKSPASGDMPGHRMTLPPELRLVIEAWPSLPRHIVRAIVALVAPEGSLAAHRLAASAMRLNGRPKPRRAPMCAPSVMTHGITPRPMAKRDCAHQGSLIGGPSPVEHGGFRQESLRGGQPPRITQARRWGKKPLRAVASGYDFRPTLAASIGDRADWNALLLSDSLRRAPIEARGPTLRIRKSAVPRRSTRRI
jgi:hypothetical protein